MASPCTAKDSCYDIVTKLSRFDPCLEVSVSLIFFSQSLIKSRAAAIGGGSVFLQGETVALAKGACGHIDCQEIIVGEKSAAKAIPIVEVRHPEARVTHEASVGKVNQKELETLMTRGLSEEEATDFIVRGAIK